MKGGNGMFKRLLFGTAFALALTATAPAQNTNNAATPPAQGQTPAAPARTRRAAQSPGEAAQLRAVREAFDSLVDGIRRADAESVAKLYWNSTQLTIFNNNGTVTKSWEQARSNRESLYAKVSDVKLDVRDVRLKALGPSGALVTCLWEQSQTSEGQPERATGRLSIVYQKIGAEWKIVHTHTSPDRPDPSRLLPSERTTTPDAGAAPKPTAPKP